MLGSEKPGWQTMNGWRRKEFGSVFNLRNGEAHQLLCWAVMTCYSLGIIIISSQMLPLYKLHSIMWWAIRLSRKSCWSDFEIIAPQNQSYNALHTQGTQEKWLRVFPWGKVQHFSGPEKNSLPHWIFFGMKNEACSQINLSVCSIPWWFKCTVHMNSCNPNPAVLFFQDKDL